MRYVVGIDIGGTNIVAGTVAEDGSELLGLVSQPTFPEQGAEAVLAADRGAPVADAHPVRARGARVAVHDLARHYADQKVVAKGRRDALERLARRCVPR